MKCILLAGLILSGCHESQPTPLDIYRGEQRIVLFKECMELAAKNTRKGDDDVSDIVNACSNQSWSLTDAIQVVPTGASK